MKMFGVKIDYGHWEDDPTKPSGHKHFVTERFGGWLAMDGASLSPTPAHFDEETAFMLMHAINHWWRDSVDEMPHDQFAHAVRVA